MGTCIIKKIMVNFIKITQKFFTELKRTLTEKYVNLRFRKYIQLIFLRQSYKNIGNKADIGAKNGLSRNLNIFTNT